MARRGAGGCALAVVLTAAVVSACGSSTSSTNAGPTPSTADSTAAPTAESTTTPATPATTEPVPSPPPSATASLASGTKSASCVNGWVQPAPGSDFYQQATAALEQREGKSGFVIKSVRYFAGPLATGGIGAIYYLDVRDPRLSSRVLLVSGAGPASVAVAKTGTTGWKPSDWTAPGGGASTVQLSPSLAGCLDNT